MLHRNDAYVTREIKKVLEGVVCLLSNIYLFIYCSSLYDDASEKRVLIKTTFALVQQLP